MIFLNEILCFCHCSFFSTSDTLIDPQFQLSVSRVATETLQQTPSQCCTPPGSCHRTVWPAAAPLGGHFRNYYRRRRGQIAAPRGPCCTDEGGRRFSTENMHCNRYRIRIELIWIPYAMDQITIKTPNPKCRLYWCLEFRDWRYSLSCWYFRPLL